MIWYHAVSLFCYVAARLQAERELHVNAAFTRGTGIVWQIRVDRLTGVCIQFPVPASATDAAREGAGEGGRAGGVSIHLKHFPDITSRVRLALSVTLRDIMRH